MRLEFGINIMRSNKKAVKLPLNAHKKCVALLIDMLIGVDYITVIFKDKVRNRRGNTLLVGTGNE